ncbi:MAG: hypothetical protein ACNS63_04355 [Candidatus Nitrospinota bacterium M3_3B_026]
MKDLLKNVEALDPMPETFTKRIEPLTSSMLEDHARFAVEEYWCGHDSVNVFDVAGTGHPGCQGMTWLEFLRNGKRMSVNLRLAGTNPGYYFSQELKNPRMYYIRLDGKLYVGGDGNHRTCIARAMFHLLPDGEWRTNIHGVDVREYRTDRAFRIVCEDLAAALEAKELRHVHVTPIREAVRREDAPGWHREYYGLTLQVENRRTSERVRLDMDRALDLLGDVRAHSWTRKFFGGPGILKG